MTLQNIYCILQQLGMRAQTILFGPGNGGCSIAIHWDYD